MRFIDILSEERVTTQLEASSKDAALLTLAELFASDDPTLDPIAIHAVLSERERLASTGVGSGVAIPHGRLSSIDRLRAALAISPVGIPFDAIDGGSVRIIVGVLAPQHHTGDHLRVLARVSRILRNVDVRESLLSAASASVAFAVIARADAAG